MAGGDGFEGRLEIGELLAETGLGGYPKALLLQPLSERGDERRGAGLPDREPLPGSSTGAVVSSMNSLVDAFRCLANQSTTTARWNAAVPTQSASMLR